MPEAVEAASIPSDPQVSIPALGQVEYAPKNIVDDDETTLKNFIQVSTEVFDRYKTEREEYDSIWEVMYYMYCAAQNRSINESEKSRGTNTSEADAEQADTGSTLYYRLVRQNAGESMAIQKSKEVPFQYDPIVNKYIFESVKEARDQANMHNMLARWVMKKDRFNIKSDDFWNHIWTYGTAVEVIYQKRTVGTRKVQIPKYTPIPMADGTQASLFAGYDTIEQEFIIDNYPSLFMVPLKNFYGDVNIGDVQNQNMVVFTHVKPYDWLVEQVAAGRFSAERLKELTDDHKWDGILGGEEIETEQTSEGHEGTTPPSETGQYLIFDILHKVPIDDSGKWDSDKNTPKIWWGTVVGNTIDEGVPFRLERNPDPDDEYPVNVTKAIPGSGDRLYSLAPGQIIRSDYAVECTLKNLAIDRGAMVNRPPILEREGSHQITDFAIKANAVWPVDDVDRSVKFMDIPSTSMETLQLLEFISDSSKSALSLDKNRAGEAFGARTSAAEATQTHRSGMQAPLSSVRYILDQRLYWYARKIKSYMEAWAEPEQVMAITDDNGTLNVFRPQDLHGEFDIEINIVDEFEDSTVRQQGLNELLSIVSQNEALAQRVDVGELLLEILKERKIDYGTIIKPDPMTSDAERVARQENRLLLSGTSVPTQPGENTQIHLTIHKAERLRFNGMEKGYDVTLLDQHIAETEAQLARGNSPAPAGQRNGNDGQAAGNALAAAQGAAQGGGIL